MRSKFRVGRGIAQGLILLGAILFTVSATLLEGTVWQEPLMYLCLALLVIAIFVIFLYCRCPYCGHVVFKNLIGAKCCPDCGQPLLPGQFNTSASKPVSRKKLKRR